MKLIPRVLVPVAFFSLIGFLRAQSGVLDQVSPFTGSGTAQSAWFNGDASSLTWQGQVRAGLSGQLEGFTLELTGAQGATLRTALRVGAGWNTTAIVLQSIITKPTSGTDDIFVDATSAGIQLVPGTLFVIEMQGQGTGTGINGTYVPPTSGAPAYTEPLFLGGPGCFADCGWRIGFKTWVVQGGTGFCFGDGSATACPCGNSSPTGDHSGCLNSLGTGGKLVASGNPSIGNDTLVFSGSQMPNSSALYFQGTTQLNGGAGVVFGDGLRCAGGAIIRLGTKSNSSGASQYPAAGDPSVSVRGLDASGDVRTYQVWYRNADPTFCTPSTFNLTNGLQITWNS
jgi:hypothetical protein